MASREKHENKLRVCIIGAGPSGLVAAKTLLHNHPGVFKVTIFEKSDRIGGLWPVSQDDDGMVNPDMCTNQSRHTVAFSDSDWRAGTPQFPKAWQVGQYLEDYRNTWIPESAICKIFTGVEVLTLKEVKDFPPGKGSATWRVQAVKISTKGVLEHEFEKVIVASGFFGKAKIPQTPKDFPVPIIHSSQFRTVKDLLKGGHQGSKIVVVGGQMSGVETAGSIAFQLSSAANSPGEQPILDVSKYIVHHVVQQPFWVMPLFFPKDPMKDSKEGSTEMVHNRASPFLPLDLIMYNLKWRPPGPIQNTSGQISPEAAKKTHSFMNTYIGTDQSELGDENLTMKGDIRSKPPWLACSDNYTEFVRSKKIITQRGKFKGVVPDKSNAIIIDNGGQIIQVDDVAAVVFATGFEAAPSLEFLGEQTQKLEFDAASSKFPLGLNVHGTINRSIPSLGFVGFYRSPYWGVMEMQARFLGKFWTGDRQAVRALQEDSTLDKISELRKSDRLAQFPMGDYAFLMENFKEILQINRWEQDELSPMLPSREQPPAIKASGPWIVLPQRYHCTPSGNTKPNVALEDIWKTMMDAEDTGKFVARAISRALQGDWKVVRSHESSIAQYPSGVFEGIAKFLPRLPTDSQYDLEYLYVEEGKFKTVTGLEMPAKRRYAYRYVESKDGTIKDKLSVWFIKPDDLTVDYHFHDMKILHPKEPGHGWRATASHWCSPDTYDVEYEFRFKGVGLEEWTMNYKVIGPNKDYVLKSTFRRQS